MVNKIKFNADQVRKEMQDKGISLRYFCKETGLCSHSTLCKYLKESAVPEERWNDFEEALHKFGLCELDEGIERLLPEKTGRIFEDLKNAINDVFGLSNYDQQEEEMVVEKIYPKKFTEKCSDIYKHNADEMPMMIVEKTADFYHAVCKIEHWHDWYDRNASEEKDYEELADCEENLINRMADILISIECARQMYGIRVDEVRKAIKKKQKKCY